MASGEWRDYAIDFRPGMAIFSIFRHTSEQPLFAIANFAKACETTLADGKLDQIDKLREWTHKIGQQATRAGEIIRRLREFAARGETERRIEPQRECFLGRAGHGW